MNIEGLTVDCEEGTEEWALTHLTLDDLSPDGQFGSTTVIAPLHSSRGWEVGFIRGRVGKKRASGFVFELYDPYAFPEETANQNECWTNGKVRWSARRLPGHDHPPIVDRRGDDPPDHGVPAQSGHYEGNLAFSEQILTVDVTDDRRGGVATVSSELPLSCDAGPTVAAPTGPIDVRVRPDGTFERFVDAEVDDARSLIWVRGRAVSGTRLRGAIARFEDPLDPPGSPNRPECAGRGRWTVDRTR